MYGTANGTIKVNVINSDGNVLPAKLPITVVPGIGRTLFSSVTTTRRYCRRQQKAECLTVGVLECLVEQAGLATRDDRQRRELTNSRQRCQGDRSSVATIISMRRYSSTTPLSIEPRVGESSSDNCSSRDAPFSNYDNMPQAAWTGQRRLGAHILCI